MRHLAEGVASFFVEPFLCAELPFFIMLFAVGVAAVPVWAYITGAETAAKNRIATNK